MILNYNGGEADSLNDLRLKRFRAMVTDRKTAIHPRNLPPTSLTAMLHRFRVYHQVGPQWKHALGFCVILLVLLI